MNERMPVFVKIDDYKDVLDVIELIRSKIAQAHSTIQKINGLKSEENAELDMWKANLNDIEQKISKIDNSLLEPDSF